MITEKDCCAVTLCALVLSDMRYLRDLREKEGLSIYQIAYRAGMWYVHYMSLEEGYMAMTKSFAKKIAKYYKIDWKELYAN